MHDSRYDQRAVYQTLYNGYRTENALLSIANTPCVKSLARLLSLSTLCVMFRQKEKW